MKYPKLQDTIQSLYEEYMERKLLDAEARDLAVDLTRGGRFEEAGAQYTKLLGSTIPDADILHDLGMLYQRQGLYDRACESLLQSLQRDSSRAEYHYDFGSSLQGFACPRDVADRYLCTIGLNAPPDPNGRWVENQDGLVLLERALPSPKEEADWMNSPESNLRLGHLNLALHRIVEAIERYEAGLQMDQENIPILEGLAFALYISGQKSRAALLSGDASYAQKKYSDAVVHYRQGLRGQAGDPRVYARLAYSYYRLEEYRQAVFVCRKSAKLGLATPWLYVIWVDSLLLLGRTDAAIDVATDASRLHPYSIELAHLKNLLLPIVYRSTYEIEQFRSRFAKGLERMETTFDPDDPATLRNVPQGVCTNFHLAYQGRNDLELQKRYGRFITKIMARRYSQWSRPMKMPGLFSDGRIRVGYVSTHIGFHSVGRLFLGWLTEHNHDDFDIRTYSVNERSDLIVREFQTASDRFMSFPRDLETICHQICADELHILVILDIGMDPLMTQIGALRLAPVQCVAWGHPVTTGLPNIDYFISSDSMESSNADSHYSEELVRLPGIGFSVPRPFLGDLKKTRKDFGLSEDAVIYLCAQAFFKYLPEYDDLFPAIANRVQESKFVFIRRQGHSRELTRLFKKRLSGAFHRNGLDGRGHLVFVEKQDYPDYLALNRLSDIFLDTMDWSGGVTTLDALACSLPVVTQPGEFFRSRLSAAFLECMDVTDTVASNTMDYVKIAVRLGSDENYRRELALRLSERLDRLFDKRACVPALEGFYRKAVMDKS